MKIELVKEGNYYHIEKDNFTCKIVLRPANISEKEYEILALKEFDEYYTLQQIKKKVIKSKEII